MNHPAEKRRIGIFQADWPLQSQTANCAFMLARAGYEVDLFLNNVPQYFDIQSSPEFQENPNIHLHIYGNREDDLHFPFPLRSNKIFLKKLNTLMARLFLRMLITMRWKQSVINEAVLKQSADFIEGKNFRLFIGIEKKGLLWAGNMGDRFSCPYLYYSLELYTKDHPDAMLTYLDRQIKKAEAVYHKKAAATIIQDAARACVLFEDNGVPPDGLTFYVPVSLLGAARQERSSFFNYKYKLPPTQKIILQFGLFYNRRFSAELIDVARQFTSDSTLVLHGYSLSESYQNIIENKCHDKFIFSNELVPSEQIIDVISSADIGLVFYTAETENDLLTAFASEKLALYLQQGKPIVAFDYPGYRKLINECECGVLIHSLSELPQAISTILADWDRYSRNAVKCFNKYYNYSDNFTPVIEWLNRNLKPQEVLPLGKVMHDC